MKKHTYKTTEKLLKEIGLAIVLLVTLMIWARCCFSDRPTEESQSQEMLDYHRTQGRDARIIDGQIIVFK